MLLLIFVRGETPRESEKLRVSLFRNPVDFWSTWIGQSEHSSDLVKSLPRGVINGLPQQLHIVHQVSD